MAKQAHSAKINQFQFVFYECASVYLRDLYWMRRQFQSMYRNVVFIKIETTVEGEFELWWVFISFLRARDKDVDDEVCLIPYSFSLSIPNLTLLSVETAARIIN